ncbi:DUF4102 domain-containing protein [Scytonema hofmannii FACHB-248]|uniref:DUF4102 domain-containing protein n=1 Tax=Scytonema hofmannii FACHB-248 TaxID=1842502 RepID=A0ABR8H2P6_9CYAN|nr:MULTISPECIES: hypothetical protein [Nostocales]MBD2609515.1 DUF4102 domain-containing protein [Scytonema hofmannii FACHB-248]
MHQPKQLQLFEILIQPEIKAIYDPYWDEITNSVGGQISVDESPYKSVGGQVITDTQKVAPQHDGKLYDRDTVDKTTHWVEKYWVERVGQKYWYYRYCWMEGRKISRIYIGAVASKKAMKKKQAVEDAILDGQSPQEIKQLIRDFKVCPHVPPLHHCPKLS